MESEPQFDCPECDARVGPSLIAACASVGIEHAESTRQMVAHYLHLYHDRGHRDA